MNKKLNKISILALVLSVLFCLTAFILPTVSRYITITRAPFDGSDELDYTVNAVFEVKNQDDLFAAINQGYSYVQLSKDIENPLIVTEKAENLDADLILDLNGIEIQRNGYEPILNVNEGVRLTVVDTSTEQTGGLYNPVGSVFNIKGGTLTVVTGTFESGPRYSEYYSYNEDILSSETDYTKRTLVEPTAQKVNYYTRNSEGDFDTPTVKNAPIIRSYPVVTGDIIYNHGNLYFDHTITRGDLTITPDTYCYYRTSEDKSASDDSQVAADWFYSYFVTRDYYAYYGTNIDGVANPEDYIEITIYGYEDVIDGASKIATPADYYAAIQMQSGTLEVQSGSFNSYFGVDTTACVNSQGGKITVKSGEFSSRIPDALSQAADSVDIKEDDSLAYDATYFYHYDWSTEANGSLAKKGQSYCILNGGNAEVSIGDGKFYSSDNSTIHMKGGKLNIGAGTISKKTTTAAPGVNLTAAQIPYYSAIYMENGELAVSNAEFNVLGDRTLGMTMQNGLLEITNATCNLSGSYVYGIKSSVSGLNNFNVTDVTFNLTGGDSQTGIYAENGRVNVSSTSTGDIKTMTVDGQSSVGILVTNGGSVNSTAYNYVLNGSGSAGIYSAENGAIDMTNGEMQVKGDNSYGIYSLVTGDDSFTVTDVSILMTGGGTNQTGIYSANGKVTVSTSSSRTISTSGANGKGIHVTAGGSVDSTNYSYTLSGDGSIGILAESTATAINVKNGDMTIEGAQSYGIRSLITGTDSFTVTDVSILMTGGGTNQTGIYSANGKVTVSTSSSRTISTSGANGKGIHVTAGGSVDSTNYSYTLSGDGSIGILADSDATGINVVNGAMSVGGSLTYGIKSSITGTTNFTVTDLPITMHGGTNQTGIYSANGKVTVSAGTPVSISTSGANGKGIYVLDGGSVASTNYSYFLTGNNSIGIDAEVDAVSIDARDGTMEITGDNSYGIRSYINDGGSNNKFNVNDISIRMTNGENQTGIFSENGRVNVTANTATLISIEGNSGKGIHVANGGSVYSDSYNYTLNGDYSYGIYSIGGMVEVKSTTIDLESNVSCYGIYARSDVESISIDLVDGFIDVGYNAGGTKTGTVAASVGVFMATNNSANTVNITRSKIHSYEIGIALEGGSLNVNETATVLTQKASSIVVLGGNLTFAESTTENADGGVGAGFSYVLSSSNTRATKNMTASSRNTLLGYYTNSYNLTLPTAYGGTQNYANRDGVYVSSDAGNSRLDILGKVKIEHAGLANNIYTSGTTKYTRYDQVVINSYAVAVSGGNVNIRKAEITAHVGGGVSCSDGNITLGVSDSLTNNDDITVLAKGNITDDANSTSNTQSNQTNYNSIGTYVTVGWMNERSVTGGNAVALIGGNITVYGGYFEATFGNGVSATVPTSFTSGQDGGTINVLGGTFIGWHNDDDNDLTDARKSGPAAHYGLKVIGGCNVNIYGGTFDGGNGGALVTGINKFTSRTNISSTNNKYATVRVYAGKFGDSQSATPANLDGFNVYDMSDVVFGAHPANTYASASDYANAIVIYAQNAAIATNPITEAATRIGSTVRVYYGSYHPVQTGTEDGNWNANATCTFYNTRTNHTLYFVKTANNFNIVNNQTAEFFVA